MKAHFSYLKYVLRHKWFVFLACLKLRVPFHLAIWHDMSKFMLSEWSPYVHQFYNPDGSKREVRDSTGAYDPNRQPDKFKLAWLHHQKLKHHWQSWVSIGDGGSLSAMEMPEKYIREMVADWVGAGRAGAGISDPNAWYSKNSHKMILNELTRTEVERLLSELAAK